MSTKMRLTCSFGSSAEMTLTFAEGIDSLATICRMDPVVVNISKWSEPLFFFPVG